MDMKSKNKGAVVARKAREEGGDNGAGGLVLDWVEEQPDECWLHTFAVLALMDGDKGNEQIREIMDRREAALLALARDPKANIDPEMRMMLGAWAALEAIS